MASFLSPFFLLAMLFGGENSLSGYVSPEQYWKNRDITYEVEAISALLEGENPSDPVTIRKWVEQLGADKFAERKAASDALAEIGAPAQTQLIAASENRDPEVAQRSKDLLAYLKEEAAQKDPMDTWMALYSLTQMPDPSAVAQVKKIAEGPEGELQQQAQNILDSASQAEVPLPALAKVLSGFPTDTRAVLQVQPGNKNAALLKTVYESPALQQQLIRVLELTGDFKLHRITLGLNEGVFLQQAGRVTLRVDMNYDPQRVAAALEKARFHRLEAPEMPMLQNHQITLALPNADTLLVFWDFDRENIAGIVDAQNLMKETSALPFSGALQTQIQQLPTDAFICGAAELSEEMMKDQEGYHGLRQLDLRVDQVEDRLLVQMQCRTLDAAAAEKANKTFSQEIAQILTMLQNEREQWVAPLVQVLKSVKVSNQQETAQVEGKVSSEVLIGFVNLFERSMQQMQARRQRQLNRQQMMQNRVHFR